MFLVQLISLYYANAYMFAAIPSTYTTPKHIGLWRAHLIMLRQSIYVCGEPIVL